VLDQENQAQRWAIKRALSGSPLPDRLAGYAKQVGGFRVA